MDFLKNIGEKLNKLIIEEWVLQGHKLGGTFERELEYETYSEGDKMGVIGRGVNYGLFLNKGVSANRIPYSRGSGARKSAYIQGLIKYVLLRMGIGGQQGVSIAFAIANTHKKDGMPTDKSKKYSSTGKRIEFVEDAFKKGEREIDEIVGEELDGYVTRLLT